MQDRFGEYELVSAVTTSSDDCAIAYWSIGNPAGIPIVLLHGFSLDHSIWSPVYSKEALLQRCYFVMPDLRGHGRSGHPSSASRYTDGDLWAADMDALIRASGIDRPAVVAWSYSGRMLFDFLRTRGQDSVRCLNLVAAASLAMREAIGRHHRCLELMCSREPETAGAACVQFVSEILRIPPRTGEFDHMVAATRMTTPEQRGWMRQRALDYDDLISGIDIPVLVTHGDSDTVVLPMLATALHEAIPSSQLALYEGAGHAPFRDDPERFCRELLAFVSSVTVGRAEV